MILVWREGRWVVAERTTVVSRGWEEPHDARYGAPAGTDRMHVEITISEFQGRKYQNETLYCNGVIVYGANYPAETEYAKGRIEQFTTGAK